MQTIGEKIKKWVAKVKSSILKYRKGFYEIPFVSNSPEVLVSSSSAFSFVKNHKDKNYLSVNNPFVKIELNYFKLEEGLWLLFSETNYKQNIKFIPHFDDDDTAANNYYILSLNLCSNHKTLQIKGHKEVFKTANYYWCFFKPRGNVTTFNYKKSEAQYITVFFNKQWMMNNLGLDLNFAKSSFRDFINSNKAFVIWPEINVDYKLLFPEIKQHFLNFRADKKMNLLSLKSRAYKLIQDFVEMYEEQKINPDDLDLKDEQRDLMQRVENYLQNNLTKKFEGIEAIADHFKISETKLKNDFRRIYGQPIYQYFNERQMLFAKNVLQAKELQIKELAYIFGYDTPGKFSKAFKRHIGILPSEWQKLAMKE